MRRFSVSALARRRVVQNPRPLELRRPVEPTVKDIKTPDSHPLWQFFGDKQYLRPPADVREAGEAWSIPQLRRKSFDDLHTLWYVCLRELNALYREATIVRSWNARPGRESDLQGNNSAFDEAAGKVKATLKRIRHVLAERYHGYKRGELELGEEYPKLLQEFSESFLEADSNSDAEVAGQMERFQYAFYGINPLLEDNVPTPKVVQGLYAMAKLKLQRYASEQSTVNSVDDIREAFVLFTCNHTPEAVAEAIKTIEEVRQDAEPVEDEMETLAQLMLATKEN